MSIALVCGSHYQHCFRHMVGNARIHLLQWTSPEAQVRPGKEWRAQAADRLRHSLLLAVIILSIIEVIIVLLLIFLRKRILIAIALIKEASR